MGFEYKCVAAPMDIIIKKQADMDQAVANFANIINSRPAQSLIFTPWSKYQRLCRQAV